MKRTLFSPFALLVLAAACGDSAPGTTAPKVQLLADTNRNGKIDEGDPSEWKDHGVYDDTHGAIVVANIDDDLKKCPKTGNTEELAKCNDAADKIVNGDDDLLDMAPLRIPAFPGVAAGATGTLTIADPGASKVRIFKNTGGEWEAQEGDISFTTDELKAGVDLRLEAKDIIRDAKVWDGLVEISLDVSAGGKSLGTDTVALHVAPVIFPSHLDPVEQVYASNLPETDSSNFQSALTAFSKTLELPNTIGVSKEDIWAQDYFDIAFTEMPGTEGPHRIHVYVHSSNYADGWGEGNTTGFRPAGDAVFTTFRGPDAGGIIAFDPKHSDAMDSLNSFGNMEVIPPYTLGDKKYPFGRVIRGHIPKFYPDPVFDKMHESQGLQPPVYVDTSWLVVSHIDEVISFFPNDTKRGWSVVYADPARAKQMFDELKAKGQGSLKLHEDLYWIGDTGKPTPATITVEGVLGDADVMATSQKAAIKVKEIVDTLKTEAGLGDDELGSVPFLFMSLDGAAIAYQPGMVNGISIAKGHFGAPKPHGPVVDGKDIFEAAMEDTAKAHGTTIQWIEDWDLLHVNEGEVHCGSNVRRVPAAKDGYWKVAR